MTNNIDHLKNDILKLKKEKNALILAHLYQNPEIQEIADYTGDSYYLSELAMNSDKDFIVFCGVKFMADSAKILSPEKTVILPAVESSCPMADMAVPEDLEDMIAKHPDALKVCYINSSYEVKALCDVSVTSSSAIEILKNVDNNKILFLPDKNLGEYLSEFFPEKEFILWNGFCPTHHRIEKESILNMKKLHPNALVLTHPECRKEIREISDYVGSTSGIIKFATENQCNEYIICTESGILYSLEKNNPNKKFYFPENIVCPNMKKTRLEDVYKALSEEVEEITLDENIRKKALISLENMHKLGK